jgi:hypothetical protein
MEEAAEDLRFNYTEFKNEFEAFFPELKKFCDEWIRRQASLGTNPGY